MRVPRSPLELLLEPQLENSPSEEHGEKCYRNQTEGDEHVVVRKKITRAINARMKAVKMQSVW